MREDLANSLLESVHTKYKEGIRMRKKEKFNDWLFRYQYIYRSRFSEKSKQRFLRALVTDIAEIREDISVIEYDRQKKYASRNIYVGNVEKADHIICTYYDTPPKHFGSYFLFDRKEQARRTTISILISSLLMILFGILVTSFYIKFLTTEFVLFSFQTLLLISFFGGYFVLLGRITKGALNKKTLARNTSSVLALLKIINETRSKRIAFAFIDEGSYGEKGLKSLLESAKNSTQIFYLDSVGANAPLYALGNGFNKTQLRKLGIESGLSKDKINYLFSAKTTIKDKKRIFYLNKKELKQKRLNKDNLTKTVELLT